MEHSKAIELAKKINQILLPALKISQKCDYQCLQTIKEVYPQIYRTSLLNLGCSTCVKSYLNELISWHRRYESELQPEPEVQPELQPEVQPETEPQQETLDLTKKKKGCCKEVKKSSNKKNGSK
jgi:hypothetical protein